ncbi:MAG: hypothetical protein QG614_301 [Patescibacteria group bacterium]|nr:hypothetical protein [Patescibacteria group bacterium]
MKKDDQDKDIQNEEVIDLLSAYKKIYKTENILSAVLLVTENVRTTYKSDYHNYESLVKSIENLVYKTIDNYYRDGSVVRDNLVNMIFYINVLKLKNLVSDNNYSSLYSAYQTLIEAYEIIYKKESFGESADIEDLDLGIQADVIAEDFLSDNKDNGFEEEGEIDDFESEGEQDFKNLYNIYNQNFNSKRQQSNEAQQEREALHKGQKEKGRDLDNYKGQIRDRQVKRLGAREEETNNSKGSISEVSKRQLTRREEIMDILSTTEPVAIKDISDKVMGCSEKTIQRELNSMLEDGVIERIGEKRWSKYLLKK